MKAKGTRATYEGRDLTGWPVLAMVHGRVMLEDGEIVGPPGHGRYRRRAAERSAGVGT